MISNPAPPTHGDMPSSAPDESCRKKILLVDEDAESSTKLEKLIANQGHAVFRTDDATAAVAERARIEPDLAIVDFDLTSAASIRLTLALASGPTPFIVYSGLDDVVHRVVALRLGADNYLLKPMDDRLVVAHVDACLRQSVRQKTLEATRDQTVLGPFEINRTSRRIRYDGTVVRLSGNEFQLFSVLAERFGEIVARDDLMSRLQIEEETGLSRTLDQRIFQLRKRLCEAGAPKESVQSVRGKGFLLSGLSSSATPQTRAMEPRRPGGHWNASPTLQAAR